MDLYLCSTQFREWEFVIWYSTISATAATTIIITTYNISTPCNISRFSHLCPYICILTPSAVFIRICSSGRDNSISPSPSSAFIRNNTRTDAVHNTPSATYTQRCEYYHKNLCTIILVQDKVCKLQVGFFPTG
jgi:hypothetical protein